MIRHMTVYLPEDMGYLWSKPPPPPPSPPPPPTVKWGQDVKLDWSPEGEENLRRDIAKVTQRDGLIIILFGQTGFGKSSFGNGLQTAMRGNKKVSNYFPVGTHVRGSYKPNDNSEFPGGIHAGGSYTQNLHRIVFCRKSCQENCTCEPYFWLIDTPGKSNSDLITEENLQKLVTGEVPFYKEIKPTLEPMDSSNVLPPKDRVQASCVVIVLKAGVSISNDVKRQINVLRTLHAQGVLSVHVVLTHPDAVDPSLRESNNIPRVFDSEEVRAAVEFASTETSFSQTCISVVMNYTVQKSTTLYHRILYLHALENILLDAKDTHEREEYKNKMEETVYTRSPQPQ